MKPEEKEVKKAAKDIGKQIKEDEALGLSEPIQSLFRTGKLPREAWKISDAKIEELYSQGYRLYNTGRYKEAVLLFRTLIMINPEEPKYYMGLAACFHMQKEFKNAVETYTLCSILDGDNPIPLFHSSDCFIQSGDKYSALTVLEMAVKRAGDNPQYQILKDRALLTIEGLKKDLSNKVNT